MTNYKPLRKLPGRSIIARAFLTALIVLTFFVARAQHATVQAGPWNDPLTWGTTPPDATSATIAITHAVTIPAGASINADQITIGTGGSLVVAATGTFTLADGTGTDLAITGNGTLTVNGIFVGSSGTTFSGTTTVNTNFQAGSEYRHQHVGAIPTASWSTTSTLSLVNFTTAGTINSTSWAQPFGNVVINLPALAGPLSFGGQLRDINGDLTITNVNNKPVTFATSTNPTITIDGSLNIASGHRCDRAI
jgi:hypothetical protein